jgi:hypothetical protein
MDVNLSAARSLEEGIEETLHGSQAARPGPASPDLVLHQRDRVGILDYRNRLPQREALADGDHTERWVGSGLLVAERQFRKVIGYRQIPCCYPPWPTWFLRNRLPNRMRARNV